MAPGPRIVVACGLITDGRRLLIARRKANVSFPGCWEFPGGKPDPGEDLAQALVRECREELGVTVQVLRPVARVNYPHGEGHITLEVFLCHLPIAEAVQCIEVDEVKWVDPRTLPEYQFPPANSRLVAQIAALDWEEWITQESQLWI